LVVGVSAVGEVVVVVAAGEKDGEVVAAAERGRPKGTEGVVMVEDVATEINTSMKARHMGMGPAAGIELIELMGTRMSNNFLTDEVRETVHRRFCSRHLFVRSTLRVRSLVCLLPLACSK